MMRRNVTASAKEFTDRVFSTNVEQKQKRKYERLKYLYQDDGFSDAQFQKVETRIPWKAIGLAVFLFCGGSLALAMALMALSNHIDGQPTDGPLVLLTLGLLMFVPGFYHVRIAYYAFREYDGYSFDDIPSFD